MEVLRFFGVFLLVLVLLVVLREWKVRHAVLFSVAGGIFFLFYALEQLSGVFSYLSQLSAQNGFSVYFDVLLKALGIGLVTGLLAEFCRDLGEGTLARCAELCGKGMMLAFAFPLLKDFLEMLTQAVSQAE